MLTTYIFRHQKQALTFMRRREQGWAFGSGGHDVWDAVDDYRGLQYVYNSPCLGTCTRANSDLSYYSSFLNRIDETYQREEPPPLRGGIIADPMGLGKTLTMIALVAAERDSGTGSGPSNDGGSSTGCIPRSTLIIVPPPRRCPSNVSMDSSQRPSLFFFLEAARRHLLRQLKLT